jgi:hypothetical protein
MSLLPLLLVGYFYLFEGTFLFWTDDWDCQIHDLVAGHDAAPVSVGLLLEMIELFNFDVLMLGHFFVVFYGC